MATGGKTWKLSNHFFSDREKRTLCCQQIVHERTQNTNIAIFSFTAASKELQKTFRGVVKNGYFTVRLIVRGVGVSPMGPDRKEM